MLFVFVVSLPDLPLLLLADAPRPHAATPLPSSGATVPLLCSRSAGHQAHLPPDAGRLPPQGLSVSPAHAPPDAVGAALVRSVARRHPPPCRHHPASAGARQAPARPGPLETPGFPPRLPAEATSTHHGGQPALRADSPTPAPHSRPVARDSSPPPTTTDQSAGSPAPQSHTRPKGTVHELHNSYYFYHVTMSWLALSWILFLVNV